MYKPIIGLEIHVELKTNSKMFCGCKNNPDEKEPNFNVCPICMGHPGTLPVANEEAIKKVIKTGLALNCQINRESKFDRKNYFYPDLPKGYQISQYDAPFCKDGYLEMPIFGENAGSKKSQFPISNFQSNPKSQILKFKKIRIRRVHLEEDTGRLLHPAGENYSLVDFNRAGIPLMELVTEPDLESGLEVRRFAEELQLILRYLGVSDADMEKGEMRVEVNISLNQESRIKNKELGTKVEIKNLNSFRAAEKAVEYEIKRQTEILDAGKKVIQETRGWDDGKGETFSQREKEEAHDYRYFPEPDLPPVVLSEDFIEKIKAEIPELPADKRKRMAQEYGLDGKSIEIFTDNKDLGEYFEKVASEIVVDKKEEKYKSLIKLSANYIITDLQGLLGGQFTEKECEITPENFAEFIILINDGKITSKTAKEILVQMLQTGKDPSQIIEEKGLGQISDEKEIEKAVRKVIEENQGAVEDYKKGKQNTLQFLAGKVIAETQGKANPGIVQKLLKKILS